MKKRKKKVKWVLREKELGKRLEFERKRKRKWVSEKIKKKKKTLEGKEKA